MMPAHEAPTEVLCPLLRQAQMWGLHFFASFLDESMKYHQHYPELQDNNSPDGARTIAERLLPGFLLNLLRNAIDPPQTD